MNAREERGLVIAALCKLNKTSDCWLVPSQSQSDRLYRVDPSQQTCTCPDHKEAGHKCKHLYAVEITMKRETREDGTIIDTRSVTFTERVTYSQNWPAYNRGQAIEKRRLQVLLHDLCRNLADDERAPNRRGPKPHCMRDRIFAMTFKVYCGLSSRRFTTDLDEAHEKGYTIRRVPMSKVWEFMEDERCLPVLHQLIAASAAPLRSVETDFAIDSSGFGSSRYERWYDEKYGVTRTRAKWVKAHIATGVKTNVVTSVRVLEQHSADSPLFTNLLTETAKSFRIGQVSADKAYGSLENFEAVADFGGHAFIAFKENATGFVGGMFQKAFHFFQLHQEEYMAQYHKRSNVESTFSAIKRKFGDSVRSKTDVAMKNEVLCKILCHNLTCLIQEQETLGIIPFFWKDEDGQDDPNILMLPRAR